MKTETLDILDADLQAHYNKYATMSYDDREKLFTHNILVDPARSEEYWRENRSQLEALSWTTVRYCEAAKNGHIDDLDKHRIGIYVFIARPEHQIMSLPHFVLYVGIAGENSNRSLRDRLRDYFRIRQIQKRENIHKFLQLYYHETYIMYTYFDGPSEDLKALEVALHEFFQPKIPIREYSPETKSARRAWQI